MHLPAPIRSRLSDRLSADAPLASRSSRRQVSAPPHGVPQRRSKRTVCGRCRRTDCLQLRFYWCGTELERTFLGRYRFAFSGAPNTNVTSTEGYYGWARRVIGRKVQGA